MRKFIIFVMLLSLLLTGCFNKKQETAESVDYDLQMAKTQISNYLNYQPDLTELDKIVGYQDFNYYYASNGKRYTFPDEIIFKSWFPNTDIESIPEAELEKLYETSLGGNVSLRPGTLLMTETDPKIYMVTDHNNLMIFGNLTLLEKLYGNNYGQYVVDLPNKFYTQYNIIGTINQPEQIPQINPEEKINDNLGF